MFSYFPDIPFYWSDIPGFIWNAYVKNLWNYQPESWVARTASTFRVLAVVVILPVVILTLLDVTSYIIARTLGILDDVKASTGDAAEGGTMSLSAPTAHVQSSPLADESKERHPRAANGSEGQWHSGTPRNRGHNVNDVGRPDERGNHEVYDESNHAEGESRPQAYFAGEDDLQLAGVGDFSPAASQPSSPVLPRMKLSMLEGGIVKATEGQPGSSIRRRPQERTGGEGN